MNNAIRQYCLSWMLSATLCATLLCTVQAQEKTDANKVPAADNIKTTPVELNEKTYKDIIKKILPDPVEDKWKEVGWRTFFWDAVQEAEKLQRPVLLWTMNGHPCAKT